MISSGSIGIRWIEGGYVAALLYSRSFVVRDRLLFIRISSGHILHLPSGNALSEGRARCVPSHIPCIFRERDNDSIPAPLGIDKADSPHEDLCHNNCSTGKVPECL